MPCGLLRTDSRFVLRVLREPGGRGRIRTFVARKERQIYSLLVLATHPPVPDFVIQSLPATLNTAGTSSPVLEIDLELARGAFYSLFAAGAASDIAPLVLEDDLSLFELGKAHIRFIHLSPDAPAVDVAVSGGTVLFDDKSFMEFTDFMPVDGGVYDLEVRAAGTTDVVLEVPGVELKAGKVYTVFARGFVGGVDGQELGVEMIVNR